MPNWQPISTLPGSWRDALIIQVESGLVGTRAKFVIQQVYEPTELFSACARLLHRIRITSKTLNLSGGEEFVRYLPCYDRLIQAIEYKECLSSIIGREASSSFVEVCLQMQAEEFFKLPIVEDHSSARGPIIGQFVNSVHGKVDWGAASHFWRCGERNYQGKRVGYDAFHIEFDYEAAASLGCPILVNDSQNE